MSKFSAESRAKISAAAKRRWERIRAQPDGEKVVAEIVANARRGIGRPKNDPQRYTFDPLLMTAMFKKD